MIAHQHNVLLVAKKPCIPGHCFWNFGLVIGSFQEQMPGEIFTVFDRLGLLKIVFQPEELKEHWKQPKGMFLLSAQYRLGLFDLGCGASYTDVCQHLW